MKWQTSVLLQEPEVLTRTQFQVPSPPDEDMDSCYEYTAAKFDVGVQGTKEASIRMCQEHQQGQRL